MDGQTERVPDELYAELGKLWAKVQREEAEHFPLPDGLTESEERALFVARMLAAGPGVTVSEEEMGAFLKAACEAKALWDTFRGAMAGVLHVTLDAAGEPLISLTEHFVRNNPELIASLKRGDPA